MESKSNKSTSEKEEGFYRSIPKASRSSKSSRTKVCRQEEKRREFMRAAATNWKDVEQKFIPSKRKNPPLPTASPPSLQHLCLRLLGVILSEDQWELLQQLPQLAQGMFFEYFSKRRTITTSLLQALPDPSLFDIPQYVKVDGKSLNKLLKSNPRLRSVDLSATVVTKEIGNSLSHLTSLEKLNLCGWKIKQKDMVSICRLSKLQSLSLENTKVNDEGIQQLTSLNSLTDLNLKKCHMVTPAGFKSLAKCTSLSSLNLTSLKLSKKMDFIPDLKSVTSLTLTKAKIQNSDIVHLKQCPNLAKLNLFGANVSVVDQLAEITSLTDLNIALTNIRIAAMKHFTKLTKLQYLDASHLTSVYSQETDAQAAVKALSEMPSLKLLVMYGSDFTISKNTGAVFLGDDVDVNKVVSLLETIEDLQILRELCFCLRLMTYGYDEPEPTKISITNPSYKIPQKLRKFKEQIYQKQTKTIRWWNQRKSNPQKIKAPEVCISLLINMLNKHTDEIVLFETMWALLNLTHYEYNQEAMVTHGAIGTMLSVIERFSYHEVAVTIALQILHILLFTDELCRYARNLGAITIAVDVLKYNLFYYPKPAKQAVLLLNKLLNNEDAVKYFVSVCDGCQVLSDVLHHHQLQLHLQHAVLVVLIKCINYDVFVRDAYNTTLLHTLTVLFKKYFPLYYVQAYRAALFGCLKVAVTLLALDTQKKAKVSEVIKQDIALLAREMGLKDLYMSDTHKVKQVDNKSIAIVPKKSKNTTILGWLSEWGN